MLRLSVVRTWLLIIIGLLFSLVLLGGITRMKLAGLSIVEWKPVVGSLPPLSTEAWQVEFNKYKLIPQSSKVFSQMDLEDFKSIFYLEYFHRLLARVIALITLAGVFFKQTRQIGLQGGGLIFFQGAIGWWMVKSGLTDRVSVAPVRLAVHFCLAMLTITYFYWQVINLRQAPPRVPTRAGYLFGLALFVQFFLGALSSGAHAAEAFPTFPLMNGEWLPSGVFPLTGAHLISDHPLASHWLHRIWGSGLLVFAVFRAVTHGGPWVRVAALLLLQFAVGILTVWTGGDIFLKLFHQAVPVLLLFTWAQAEFKVKAMKRTLAAALLLVTPLVAHATPVVDGLDLIGGKKVEIEAKGKKGVVVVFLSSTCPCSNSHVPEIVALAKDFPAFQFVGIHSNPTEELDSAKAYFKSKKLSFPVIQDEASRLADRFKALKTPHAYLLGPDHTQVFQGGVSNRSDFTHADRFYLREALQKFNQGQKIDGESARTLGCPIRRKS